MIRHGAEVGAADATAPTGHEVVRAPFGVVEEAVDAIGTTLDERTTCGEAARFLCRHGCDAVALDLLAEQAPAAGGAVTGALTRVVTAGREDLLDADLSRRGGALEVAALGDGHPVTAGTQTVGGVRCGVVSVPLLAQGALYGALLAVRTGADFSAQDTATLHYVARLTAAHLGHDRRHTAVHSTAMNLQRALLTAPGRPHPNLDIATRYLPSGGGTLVGGDWYETVRLHFGRTLLVIGDVMGHGLDAAVDMSAYRSTLRYVASTDLPPHRVLRQLDAAVSEDGSRRPATCLLARVDPARGLAAISTAGHLPPVLFTADGKGRLLDLPVGPPLGTGVGGYALTTLPLTPGDTLVLFTDGLVERRGEDIDTSLARLASLHPPPDSTPEALLDHIVLNLTTPNPEDDTAVLAARIHPR